MISHPSKSCHEVLTHFVDIKKSYWTFPGNLTSCWPMLYWGQILIYILRVSWQCGMRDSQGVISTRLTVSLREIGERKEKMWVQEFRENINVSKMCPNFMTWLRGVVDHLPWLMIHNIKPTDHGSYHVKGFQDCSMYSWNNKWVQEMSTWVESPCIIHLSKVLK